MSVSNKLFWDRNLAETLEDDNFLMGMHDNVQNVKAESLPEVEVSALGQVLNGGDERKER